MRDLSIIALDVVVFLILFVVSALGPRALGVPDSLSNAFLMVPFLYAWWRGAVRQMSGHDMLVLWALMAIASFVAFHLGPNNFWCHVVFGAVGIIFLYLLRRGEHAADDGK